MTTLAENLRRLRTKAGLTQQELAERSGVAQSSISAMESGKQKRSESLPELAVALGCLPGDLDSRYEPGWMGAPNPSAPAPSSDNRPIGSADSLTPEETRLLPFAESVVRHVISAVPGDLSYSEAAIRHLAISSIRFHATRQALRDLLQGHRTDQTPP